MKTIGKIYRAADRFLSLVKVQISLALASVILVPLNDAPYGSLLSTLAKSGMAIVSLAALAIIAGALVRMMRGERMNDFSGWHRWVGAFGVGFFVLAFPILVDMFSVCLGMECCGVAPKRPDMLRFEIAS